MQLSPGSGGTRLVLRAGNRYDYWRVALIEFRSAPLDGVGAGNYDTGYYLHRRTTEAITQPHSLELQTLAELGLVGGAVAGGLPGRRRARLAPNRARGTPRSAGAPRGGRRRRDVHRLAGPDERRLDVPDPGRDRDRAGCRRRSRVGTGVPTVALAGRARIAAIVAAAAIAIAGTVTIAPRILSLHAQASAERALDRGAPRAAIIDATTALEYDPDSVPALVLRAAGFAALHAFPSSLADLKRAVAVEPRNWVTWALVGDLLTRRGDRSGARAAYAHALALDPLEPDLKSALSASATAPGR